MSDLVPEKEVHRAGAYPAYYPPAIDVVPGLDLRSRVLDFRELARIIGRNWWVIVLVAGLCATGGHLLIQRAVTVYRASAVITFRDERSEVAGSTLAGVVDQTSGEGLRSLLQLLKSRLIAGQVVDSTGHRLRSGTRGFMVGRLENVRVTSPPNRTDSLNLLFKKNTYRVTHRKSAVEVPYGTPAEIDGVRFTAPSRIQSPEVTLVVQPFEAAVRNVIASITYEIRPSSEIVDVMYTGPDKYKDRQMVNALVQALADYSASDAALSTKKRGDFLEKRLAQANVMLDSAQTKMNEFNTRANVTASQARATALQGTLQAQDQERAQLEANRKMFVTLLEQLRVAPAPDHDIALRTLIAGTDNTQIIDAYSQMMTYIGQRADKRAAGVADRNIEVLRLDSLIQNAQRQLMDASRANIKVMDAKIGSLEEQRNRTAQQMQAANAQLTPIIVEQSRLTGKATLIQNMVNQFQQDYDLARMAEAVQLGQISIIDLATTAKEVSAARVIKYIIAAVMGVILGLAVAILREMLNASIIRREDIEMELKLPELAVIPNTAYVPTFRGRMMGMLKKNGRQAEVVKGARLATLTNNRSTVAEAYRMLRTNLTFAYPVGTLRQIVVTSPLPAEGKTTIASNLAVVFAQQGQKVLLIDCDMRRPRIHKIFDLPLTPGLSNVLNGTAQLSAAVRKTEVRGLAVLPCGTIPDNPAEMLGNTTTGAFLNKLAEQFDLVIYDTPPALTVSDAAVIGSRVDGILLVAHAGRTNREAARRATVTMRSVGGKLLGIVLNDPDRQVPRYSRYYDYYYAYGRYYTHDAEDQGAGQVDDEVLLPAGVNGDAES